MRKLVLAGFTLTIAVAMAAVAFAQYAQPVLTVTQFKVSPAAGGTTKKPKNANILQVFTVNKESRVTLKRIEYKLPAKVKLNGTGFKTCSEAAIGQGGADACPKASKVGTGAATALLGPQQTPLAFTAQVFVAGKNSMVFALTNSLVGTVPIPATITNAAGGQVVGFDIPQRVQSPVSGLYSYVTSVTANLGKQSGIKGSVTTGKGKKKKTRYFASLTGCTGGKHSGTVTTFYANNPNPPSVPQQTAPGSTTCKK